MYVYKSVAKSMVTNAHHIINSALIESCSPAGPRRRRKRTHAIGVHPLPPAFLLVTISLAAQSPAVAKGGKAPVSACEPLCAILLRKPSVLPTFACESKRGPFVREVEKCDEKRFGTELRQQLLDDICGNGFGRKAELFKPDFWTGKAVRF